MERQKRRPRTKRTRSDLRLEITPRDVEIFKLLERYRYLSSTYIHAFVGGASETRLKERLGNLFHQGYIDRPEQQWQMANCRYRPAIYEAGKLGRQMLRQKCIDAVESLTLLGKVAHHQFAHSVMICETMASIEIGVRDNPHLRLISWQEILAKAPERTRRSDRPFQIPLPISSSVGGIQEFRVPCIVPDGVFGLEYRLAERKAYRFFALEIDRGTMPVARSDQNRTSYMGKLALYRQMASAASYKTHLGLPNLLVLTITIGELRLLEMLKRVAQTSDASICLFKAIDDKHLRSPQPEVLCTPWLRGGLSALAIDRQ